MAPSEKASGGESVVVIDDEEVMRNACRDILQTEGYRVETFEDGERGLERIRREPPRVTIIDLMMPRVTGREVICEVGNLAPDTRVIVITGYATRETEEETRSCGAFGFLAKPFTPAELRTLVAEALRRDV